MQVVCGGELFLGEECRVSGKFIRRSDGMLKVVKEIPVLLYHNIGHYPADAMGDGLQPEPLKRQMRFLSENGYNVVSLSRALDHLAGRIKLPPKSIAITIDGGYRDACTNVLPILKSHNFHATFFIIAVIVCPVGFLVGSIGSIRFFRKA